MFNRQQENRMINLADMEAERQVVLNFKASCIFYEYSIYYGYVRRANMENEIRKAERSILEDLQNYCIWL